MKTIRFFGVALFTVLLSVGFSACSSSSDDDDSNGVDTSISIEGKWKMISDKEYLWDKENNKPDFDRYQGDFIKKNEENLYSFSKKGKNLLVTRHSSGKTNEWFYISENEYYFVNSKGEKSEHLVIKELTKEQLIIYIYEGYYSEHGADHGYVRTYIRQ